MSLMEAYTASCVQFTPYMQALLSGVLTCLLSNWQLFFTQKHHASSRRVRNDNFGFEMVLKWNLRNQTVLMNPQRGCAAMMSLNKYQLGVFNILPLEFGFWQRLSCYILILCFRRCFALQNDIGNEQMHEHNFCIEGGLSLCKYCFPIVNPVKLFAQNNIAFMLLNYYKYMVD